MEKNNGKWESITIIVWLLLMGGIIFGPKLYEDYTRYSRNKAEEKEREEKIKLEQATREYKAELIEKINNAIAQGDFSTAYNIIDPLLTESISMAYDLNKKILTSEITINIEQGNAAKIILCIKERAKFNDYSAAHSDHSYPPGRDRIKAEREMFKHAIQLAKAVDNDEIVSKLQKTLDSWEKAE